MKHCCFNVEVSLSPMCSMQGAFLGGEGFSPPNVRSRVGHFGSKPQISHPSWSKLVQKIRFVLKILIKIGTICLILSYFVSIGHILSHLVLFCLIKSFSSLICVIYGTYLSWSRTFLVGQLLTKSIKVDQICQYPSLTG